MGRAKKEPAYLKHQGSGQARVRVDGRDVYLGPFGSPESKKKYREVLQKWHAGAVVSKRVTLGKLCLDYLEYARGYYRKNDVETSEVSAIRVALRFLTVDRWRNLPIEDFGTSALLSVREAMIAEGLVRGSINSNVNRIRRMMAWGVQKDLVDPIQLMKLKSIPGLRAGRSDAVESEPVLPVSREHIEAIREHVQPAVWGMVQLQLWTGMRPGEVRILRWCDIDRSEAVWEYRPVRHKTEHRGKKRVVFLGPEAQRLISEFEIDSDPAEYVFGSSPVKCYSKSSYIVAIRRACVAAGIPHWSPNQLRHTAATEIRKRYGLEAARTILGHSSADVTQIYAERDDEMSRKVMAECG